jgi:demethylmenaquinone methyltransferase/2-methoxy-6-polyprenyl-1,4-benzoquinol methylase
MARNFLFDFIAPFYDLAAKPREADGRLEFLRLPSHGRMFEAGGGTGRIALGFVSFIDVVVLGDLSFNMLRRAKQNQLCMCCSIGLKPCLQRTDI